MKIFNESALLNDVAKLKFELGSKDQHEGYDTITNNFLNVFNKHAPLKKKNQLEEMMHLLGTKKVLKSYLQSN